MTVDSANTLTVSTMLRESLAKAEKSVAELRAQLADVQSKCRHVWGEAVPEYGKAAAGCVTSEGGIKPSLWRRTCAACGQAETTPYSKVVYAPAFEPAKSWYPCRESIVGVPFLVRHASIDPCEGGGCCKGKRATEG